MTLAGCVNIEENIILEGTAVILSIYYSNKQMILIFEVIVEVFSINYHCNTNGLYYLVELVDFLFDFHHNVMCINFQVKSVIESVNFCCNRETLNFYSTLVNVLYYYKYIVIYVDVRVIQVILIAHLNNILVVLVYRVILVKL